MVKHTQTIQTMRSLVVSDLRLENIGSQFESAF